MPLYPNTLTQNPPTLPPTHSFGSMTLSCCCAACEEKELALAGSVRFLISAVHIHQWTNERGTQTVLDMPWTWCTHTHTHTHTHTTSHLPPPTSHLPLTRWCIWFGVFYNIFQEFFLNYFHTLQWRGRGRGRGRGKLNVSHSTIPLP